VSYPAHPAPATATGCAEIAGLGAAEILGPAAFAAADAGSISQAATAAGSDTPVIQRRQ